MIQSRAQFGFRGVILVLIGTLFTFVGFNVANSVLTAHGLNGILGWNERAVIVGTSALGGALAVYGHDWLHRIFRWCLYLCLPLYALLCLAIVSGRVPATHPAAGAFTWAAFVSQFAASASSYNITYAPSVSDYSRSLPRRTRPSAIITAVFLGAASSAIWLITLGAWLATRLGAADGLVAPARRGRRAPARVRRGARARLVAALVATMGLNAYSGMLTVVTALNSLFEASPTPRLRVAAILGLSLATVGIAFAVSADSIALVFAVLTIMLYLLRALDLDQSGGLLLRAPGPLRRHAFLPAARHLRRLGLAGYFGLYHWLYLQHTILQFGGCV